MVINIPVACDVCGCTIRLRYQVSEIFCPIKIQCPDCKTEINGSLQTIYHYGKEGTEGFPWHYDFRIKNATETDESKCKYVLEISPDLSTNKISLDTSNPLDPNKYIPSPFMRQAIMPEGNLTQNTRFYNFLRIWEDNWESLKIKMVLCYNEKYDVLLPRLSESYNEFPDDINCIMSVHQELIKFCFKILPKDTLKNYSKIGVRLHKIVKNNPKELSALTKQYDFNYTKQIERKSLQLIKTFLDMYQKFLPVFNTLKIKEYQNSGVSTLTFEDIKTFYQDSYELILYSLPRVVALNNIYCRKDINKFAGVTEDFNKKINSYGSKVLIYSELLSKHDEFSWLVDSAIENHIRNSIGHFNYEENLDEQTIVFVDDHRGRSNTVTKTLIEIARDCVYMFYTLMNLLELNYNLLKIQTIIKD